MTDRSAIYDISVTLGEEAIPFPGDPPFSRQMLVTIEESGVCSVSKLEMSAHSGTHIDMPAHFISGGKTLDDYPAGAFIRPARVISISDPVSVKAADIDGIDIAPEEALLFKTANSATGRCKSGIYSKDFVYISPEAAMACIEKNVGLVGLDYITVEKHGDDTHPAHLKLLGNGILLLEGVNLKEVPPGQYTLICLPLKIIGGEASPVRAVLIAG